MGNLVICEESAAHVGSSVCPTLSNVDLQQKRFRADKKRANGNGLEAESS